MVRRVRHRFAMVSTGYAFIIRQGVIISAGYEGWDEQLWSDPTALKFLVVKDTKSKAVFAHALLRKGIDEKRFSVDMVVEYVPRIQQGTARIRQRASHCEAPERVARNTEGVRSGSGWRGTLATLRQPGQWGCRSCGRAGQSSDQNDEALFGKAYWKTRTSKAPDHDLACASRSCDRAISSTWARWANPI